MAHVYIEDIGKHEGEEVSINAIEVYVHRLRKKLEPGGVTIATVRGAGYRLDAPGEP